MDLVELYQLRMDKCAAEQFWMIALLGGLNGYVIAERQLLKDALGGNWLKWGILLATALGLGYILSRHFIYWHYDQLIQPLIQELANQSPGAPAPPSSGWGKGLALWSGVFFYGVVAGVMGAVSFMALTAGETLRPAQAGAGPGDGPAAPAPDAAHGAADRHTLAEPLDDRERRPQS